MVLLTSWVAGSDGRSAGFRHGSGCGGLQPAVLPVRAAVLRLPHAAQPVQVPHFGSDVGLCGFRCGCCG